LERPGLRIPAFLVYAFLKHAGNRTVRRFKRQPNPWKNDTKRVTPPAYDIGGRASWGEARTISGIVGNFHGRGDIPGAIHKFLAASAHRARIRSLGDIPINFPSRHHRDQNRMAGGWPNDGAVCTGAIGWAWRDFTQSMKFLPSDCLIRN